MSNVEKELKQKFDNLKEKFKIAYTRTQLETLLGELNSFQNEAAVYGLDFDISHLQESAKSKTKNFETEQNINISQNREEEFLKAQRAAKLAEEEKEVAQKIAALNNFHNEFITNITKDTKRIEESNKRLDKIINKLEKENIIDHEELNHEILTHEEILVQHKNHKEHYAKQKIINQEYESVSNELCKLDKEIIGLKQQLQKKDLNPEQIENLKEELTVYQELLKIHKPYLEQLSQNKRENNQKIDEYEKARKAQSDKIRKIGDNIKIHHEKGSEAYNKYKALKNQHKAIETNGIVKDKEHHNKVLTNINIHKTKSLADKMKEQTQVNNTNIGSLTPSRTPNNSTNNKTRSLTK